MAVTYFYWTSEYNTEAEVQAAVVARKNRLENNPTDWMVVKEITGSDEEGWTIHPTHLTDDEINNPDSSKTYLAYSIDAANNDFPLTASQLQEKVIEYRRIYCSFWAADRILKHDPENAPVNEGLPLPEPVVITPNEDMSGYV